MQRGHCSGRSYVRHKPIGTFREDGKELPKMGIVFPAASCGRFTQWARHHGRRAHSHVRPLRLAGSPLRARSQLLTRPSKKTAEVHLGFWTLQPPCVHGTSISWTAADFAAGSRHDGDTSNLPQNALTICLVPDGEHLK